MLTKSGTYRFSNDDLIREIEIRPAIWDASCVQYRNREIRNRQWDEVCEKVMHRLNWNELNEEEKRTVRRLLRIKWAAFRTTFKKAVVNSENIEKDEKINKPYTLVGKLNFLLSNYIYQAKSFESAGEDDDSDSTTNESPMISYEVVEIRRKEDLDLMAAINEESIDPVEEKGEDSETIVNCDKIIDNSSENDKDLLNCAEGMENSSETDRDFLMSLLPTLQKLNSHQKLEVKVQFLHILKQKLLENEK